MTCRRFLLVTIVSACSSSSATPSPPAPVPVPVPAPVAGAATYKRLCAPCHGVDGSGYIADHAPSLVSPTFLDSADDEFLRRSIVFGRPGTSMAGYGHELGGPLDGPAADQLVATIRAWGPKAKRLATVARGDATRGAPLYASLCQRCHGDATTRGEDVHLANPKFLELASDAFLKHAIVLGRPGTPMIAWAGQLTDAQIDDVVAAVRALGKPAPAPLETLLPEPTGQEPIVINPAGKAPSFVLEGDRFVAGADVAAALAQHRKMIILDARSPADWRRVHIPGARSSPYHELAKLDALPKDGTWIIAYCACPHHLSGIVVDELRKRGYTHTAVLDEGILDWHRRGFPVTAAPGVQPPPAEAPPPK